VVRGPAAVLALLAGCLAAALAYFLTAPALPDVGGTGDLNTILSDVPAMLLLAGCVLVLLHARDEPFVLALLALGGGLLAGAFTVADASAAGNVAKALFAGSLGMFLAWALAEPAVVVAVPLFVAGIDVASVAGGPTQLLAREQPRAADFLSLPLPALGGGRAGLLGVADLVFLAFFAAAAWRFGLRRRLTAVALAPGGRIAIIGVAAGAKAELNLLALMGKRARIHGSTLRARSLEEKAAAARAVERHVLPLFEAREVDVPVAHTFPMEAVAEAYERFAAGGKLGKIVLTAGG
jgi:threonine dehydrogenase-like Zn-dependent dehydrogenase